MLIAAIASVRETHAWGIPLEIALRESEDRFRLLVEGLKDYAIFMLNPDGRVMTWNAGAERLKGFAAQEIIGQHVSRFYPPEDVAAGKPQRELNIAAEQGQYVEEGWRMRKDGSRFWASVTIDALRGEAGELRGFAKLTRDETERKRAEEKLREAEREKNLILDNANEILAYHDTDNNLIWANKAYLDATGLPLSELKGRKCYACWGLDRVCEHCPVVIAIQTGEPQESEITPENQPRWPVNQGSWLIRAAPVKNPAGIIIGAIEMAHDITERKRAEEALRESESRLRLALDAARMAAWDYDPATLKVTLSENAEKVLKLPRSHENSDQGYSLIHPDDVEDHRA